MADKRGAGPRGSSAGRFPGRSTESSRRPRRRGRSARMGAERLEPRLVFSGLPASVTADQAAALMQGIETFVQRLSEVRTHGVLGEEAVAVGQPLGTLVAAGDELRTSLVERLRPTLGAVTTATPLATVQGYFTAAAAADDAAGNFFSIAGLVPTVEVWGEGEALWFTMTLRGSRTLDAYRLDLDQRPSEIAGHESLQDRGLRLGALEVPVTVGFEGSVGFGVDLGTGLAADQAFLVKVDQIRVSAEASAVGAASIPDVEAAFGVVRLGPADVNVAFDVAATVDLAGPAAARRLGDLTTVNASGLFTVAAAADSYLDVDIPFALKIGGFAQSGMNLTLGITTSDPFHAPTAAPGLDFVFPTLNTTSGGVNFEKFGDLTISDLGGYLDALRTVVPAIGSRLEVPLVDKQLDRVVDLAGEFNRLVDGLADGEAVWSFATVDEMAEQIAAGLGGNLTAASLGVRYNPQAEAIEWTIPLNLSQNVTESFELGQLVPVGVPLSVTGIGELTMNFTAALQVAGGVRLSTAANLPSAAVTGATLLSKLNRGAGLTSAVLLQNSSDLTISLRDGTTLALDLDQIAGLGNATAAGTATVQNLVDFVNAKSPLLGNGTRKLTMSLVADALVLADATSGPGSLAVAAARQNLTLGDANGTTQTVSRLSGAPLVLGLLAEPTTGSTLEGSPLASVSIRDRAYVAGGSVGQLAIKIDAEAAGGAAIGPVSLSLVNGRANGSASITAAFVDPGAGAANDSRITLAEIDAAGAVGGGGVAGPAAVVSLNVTSALQGIFQLDTSPAELRTAFKLDTAPYILAPASPLNVAFGGAGKPDTNLVPYIEVTGTGTPSAWSFDVAPSNKLRDAFTGLGDLSIDDLPDLLDLFVGQLEKAGFWDVTLPVVDLSLGEILGFADFVAGFELPDLAVLLGDPTAGTGPLFTWYTDFSATFDLALSGLDGLGDLRGRLERLLWSLGDLRVSWAGRDPGVPDFDADFLARLRGWGSAGLSWLGDYTLAFPSAPTVPIGQLVLTFDGILDGITALPVGLEGFEGLLQGLFTGFDVDLVPSLGKIGGDDALLLDVTINLPNQSFTREFAGIAAPGGLPLEIVAAGGGGGPATLALVLDGKITTQLGWNLDTLAPFVNANASSIGLKASINDSGGLELGASVGGLAGISLGSADPGRTLARLTLSNGTGAGPANFSVSGTGAVVADAALRANLPIYIDPTPDHYGNLNFSASLDLSKPDPFALDVGFQATNPSYPDLASIVSAAAANLDVWFSGVDGLIALLRTALESDLLGRIPYLRDVGLAADPFLDGLDTFLGGLSGFTTPKALADTLNTRLTALTGVSFTFERNGVALGKGDTRPFTDLLSGMSDTFVMRLVASGRSTRLIDGDALDLGAPGAGLSLRGSGGINMAVDYALNLGLGYGKTLGFFVDSSAVADEATVSVGLGFETGSALEMSLGPLYFTVADNTPGAIVAGGAVNESQALANRELHAAAAFNLPAGKASVATLDGLFDGATASLSVKAALDVALTASIVSGGPGIGASLAAGFWDGPDPGTPGARNPVTFTYTVGTGVGLPDDLVDNFHFGITETFLDMGAVVSGPLKELFATVNDALEPLKPITDLLTSEIPVVSDLSKKVGSGAVTFLDAIGWFGEGFEEATAFIETAIGVIDAVDTLTSLAGGTTLKIPLGALLAKDPKSLLSGGGPSSGSFDHDAAVSSLADAESVFDDLGLGQLKKFGIQFPILANPSTELFKLLFGGDADIVTWDVPDLACSFDFRQSFPIFPPLFATIFGGVGFQTNLAVGFDTRGIRQALSGSTFDVGKVVNGLYLDDTPGGGADVSELEFTATVGAGAELSVVVAKASVEGAVTARMGANLNDPDDDGKLHLDELVKLTRGGLECMFEFEGSLGASLAARIKVGLDTPFGFVTLWKKSFTLVDVTLVDWSASACPPVNPTLANVTTFDHDQDGGTANVTALVLNVGPRAGLVLPGETADGPETILIDQVDGNVTVTGYDDVDVFAVANLTAAGVQWIAFDAGVGDDVIELSANVTFKVYGFGGDGNDRLTTGSATGNVLRGGNDSDVLAGRAGNDSFFGEAGDDTLFGYGGADRLVGGLGDDDIYGEDAVGDLVEFKAKNPGYNAGNVGGDWIEGNEGSDSITAGGGNDSVWGGADGDTIYAGAGDDAVEGGEGNDLIFGEAGRDFIWGDDLAGTITAGGLEINADRIEGGAGPDFIWGGPGSDAIWGASEREGAAAAANHSVVDVSFLTYALRPLVVRSDPNFFHEVIFGGDGDDTIRGTAGRDFVEGGFGSDYIETNAGGDYLVGGPGGDALLATEGAADIFGGHGDDVIDGGNGTNWIEGGPGDDRIFARLGADTVYGGTTGLGYQHLEADLATGKPILDSEHGGFTSVASADDCGPEIYFHPEVYPDAPHKLTGVIFEDSDADGVRDAGEPNAPSAAVWQAKVFDYQNYQIMLADMPGGGFMLPEATGLPAGSYTLTVQSVPAGWIASNATTSLNATVTLGGASPPAQPAFGYYRPGRITGTVVSPDANGKNQPVANAFVYLDLDSNGLLDGGDPAAVTDAQGKYTFSTLRPGGYTVAVDDSRICVTVQPQSPKVVLVSGETETVDFLVTPTSAPVVEAVLVGTSGQAVSWRSVADGPDQLDPLPVAEYTLLAFDVCSSVGLGRIQAGATLFTVGADGKPKDPITLNYLGPDPARPDWIRYQAYKPTGGPALAPGRYRLTLDDQSVLAPDGSPLDGEWTNPSLTKPDGTRFHSGNGIAGGDFVFDFVIGGAAAAVAGTGLAAGDVTTNADQTQFATIQGTVWFETGANWLNPALAGQTVRLVDTVGTVKGTTVTGPIDLDGDGSVGVDEQGAFRFTGLVPGTYTVEQVPADPWRQVTDGGVVTPATLYAVTHALNNVRNTLWTIDPVTRAATIVHADFARLVARDIAMVDGATAWLTGTALAGNALAIGASGLWRMNVATGAITEIGGIPGGLPLFALDALDETTLLGVNRAGTVLLYDIPTNRWETLDPLLTVGNQRYYPVGDVAVFGPGEVYAVCTNVEYTPNTVLEPTAQKLVRFDPRVRGANASVVLDLRLGRLVVGLERQGVSGLVGLDDEWGFYSFPVAAASVTGPAGTIVVSRSIEFGGLAAAPARVTGDPTRDDFLVTIQAGETIEVGFGNRPDTILLKDGDDRIDGGCGNDSDTLFGDDGADLPSNVITEGGNDFIRGRGGNDTIRGGQQGDVLWGEEGVDAVYGGDSEPNRIEGGADDDSLYGGGAGDTIVGGTGNDTLYGYAGDDQLFGGVGNDVLYGGLDADTLVGGSGLDKSYGEAGNDTLYVIDQALAGDFLLQPTAGSLYDGGADVDTVVAGANTDMNLAVATFTAFSANHTLASIEIGLLTGGKSANTISATTFTGPTVIRGLAGNDTLRGGTTADLILGGDDDDSIAGFGGKDTLRGEAGNDTVSGGDADDVLEGGAGNDSLTGDAGNDLLDGGIGTNTLTGSSGDDTFLVTTGGTFTVVDVAGGGSDTVDLSALDGYLALRIGTVAGENTITGYASAATILDTVRVELGSSAIERIVLGSGDDDVYVKKGASTLARIDAGPGSDWLLYTSTAAWTWAANVVVDLGLGIATSVAAAAAGGIANFENAEGGEGNDRLFGNGADNIFYGWGGIDEIRGAAGNDSLYGMAGDDLLFGDADADRLHGGPGVNSLDGGIGSDTYVFATDGQTDTVTEGAVGNTDVLDFSGITSTGLDVSVSASISVTFTGGSVTVPQADRIDVVKGSAKTDRFRIANGATFAGVLDGFQTETPALANLDILDYTAWNTPVTVNYLGVVADTTAGLATGTGGVKGLRHVIGGTNKDTFKGGGLPVWFQGGAGDDRLDGSSQDDLLEGDNDVDTINGFAGNDTLRGGWGNDTLAGGTGDDTYAFADLFGTDTITEAAGEGNDTMDFGLLTLPLEVRLGSVTATSGGATATYAGNAMERVVGGAGNDTFVMNSSAVSFPGTLDGGGGTNTLRYDAATPAIVAAVNAGGTPNVGSATRFASVTAVPIYTLIDVSVPLGGTLVDGTLRKGDARLVKKGPGTLILTLANSHAYGTVVEAGEVIVRNLAALGTGVLEIRAGARVTLDIGSANWNGGTNFVALSGILLDPTGRLEIGTGQLRVAAGGFDAAAIRQALVAGRNAGTWNGAAGFTSAAAGAGTSRAIGYRVMPATGELRLGFAALGDANLDGQVSQADINLVVSGGRFGQGSATGSGWVEGDFNYSGGVTQADVNLLVGAARFGQGVYLPPQVAGMSLAASDAPSIAGWAAYGAEPLQRPMKKRR